MVDSAEYVLTWSGRSRARVWLMRQEIDGSDGDVITNLCSEFCVREVGLKGKLNQTST